MHEGADMLGQACCRGDVPAEKLFVDFAGDTVVVFDAATGMERRA
jgi:hypothetical protein